MEEARAGRLTTRDRQRMDTRERVFRAALSEFRRVGSAEAQIERIIAVAGVSVGTFYRYFSSKDAVFAELQQRYVADVARQFRERAARADTLRELLHAFVDSVLQNRGDDELTLERESLALMVRRQLPIPDWTADPMFRPLTEGFERAQQRGEIRGDVAPAKLTQLLSTSVFGFVTGVALGSSERRDNARLMVDLLLAGLSPAADAARASR